MAGEVDLATRLHSWAGEEMHFYPPSGHKAPSVDDFRALCRGPNAAVWKWVLSHVHSAETVRTVKGNLSLKSQTSSQPYKVKAGSKGENYKQEKAELLEGRGNLSREITSCLRDIGHLQTDLDRITAEIEQTEHEYERQIEAVRNVRRKGALLQAFSTKCTETSALYREYTTTINSHVDGVKNTAQKGLEKEEYYSRETDQQTDKQSPTLETASVKHVRECCESIGSFLQETLKGSFGGDRAEFGRRKEPLWRQVEEVTDQFSSDQILSALLTNTRYTTSHLKSLTDQVDIRKDAQNLRFRYEPGGEVTDLARPPSLLRSVNQLLQERASEHLQRFIAVQKYQNTARTLEQSVATVTSQVERRLQKLFADKPADLKLARSMVETEQELEELRALLHCVMGEADMLREVVGRSYTERQELFTKYHRIQEFQHITDQKQSVIQVLVKQNINSQSRLDAQIQEIQQYVERSVRSHQQQVAAVTKSLQGSVITEVKLFANLNLPYLMFSTIDNALKTAVLDLSINQQTAANLRRDLVTILTCLHFPSFQAPEMVLRRCAKLQGEVEEARHKLETERWADSWRKHQDGERDVTAVVAELCEGMKVEDERQMKRNMPVLQQRLTNLAAALTACNRTRDAARAWWEQPGQHCVPWVTEDGHTLQYYLDRWTALATGLRQLLVK